MRKRKSRSGSSHLYQKEATVRLRRIRELCKGATLDDLKVHISNFVRYDKNNVDNITWLFHHHLF